MSVQSALSESQPFSLHNPIHGQSEALEDAIERALEGVPDHDFQLVRYLIWPLYRMPVYCYTVGEYDVVLERHTSYWAFKIRRAEAFELMPFVELLEDKRQVFVGYGEHQRCVEGAIPERASELEVHAYSEERVAQFVSSSILFMRR
ncbi:MAG: hypothetical protein KBB55_02845 [Candidatus Buchananbacteria bacterium]|nr:hypothetical protein [Candidatus Buchananbacteria bacterium]